MYMTGFVFNKIRCLRLFLQVLRSLIEEKKDWYLDELTAAMKERTRKCFSSHFMAFASLLRNHKKEGICCIYKFIYFSFFTY